MIEQGHEWQVRALASVASYVAAESRDEGDHAEAAYALGAADALRLLVAADPDALLRDSEPTLVRIYDRYRASI